MFDFFKKKCPACKMKLEGGRNYPKESGKTFCSESCKEAYRKEQAEKGSLGLNDCCR